ncbi:MAG: TIR domain-containing protein [Candidatus Aminicenantes bacterium]|nr:TIR domain-containing protein [Candidatus Aminicenantes bacterium]
MKKGSIFISYSHQDEKWKDLLVKHLKVLEKEGLSAVWYDDKIEKGAYWQAEIETAIKNAQVAVLLISTDFLTSDFINRVEVPQILKRRQKEGLWVYPVIAEPCAWEQVKWLSAMQLAVKEPLAGQDEVEIDKKLAALTNKIGDDFKKGKGVATRPGETRFYPLPAQDVDTSKLPITGSDLFGREKQLAILDNAWVDSTTGVVTVIAWGGVGKSALINKWLNRLAKDNYRGAEKVYGWSFYSQGAAEGRQASADLFMQEALRWFGDPEPETGTPEEKGSRLAELVRRQRTLLILDGLEPLQFPPHENMTYPGRLKDRGLAKLLRLLAAAQPGLCVITSREPVTDLSAQSGSSVQEMNLDKLAPAAGAQLLKHLGVNKTAGGAASSPSVPSVSSVANFFEREMFRAVEEYDGHALALTLLGNYLSVCCGGDIRKRDTVPRLTGERRQGRHAKRVMAAYCNHLKGSAELDILFMMGLFDRPAPAGAIAALRQEPVIPGVTDRLQNLSHEDWLYALDNLRSAHLLAKENPISPGSLDCHPLVREYFGERLAKEQPQGFKAAHQRLYNYYKNLPKKKQPDTIREMEPLFAAIAHGCAAGLHQEAVIDVYWKRVSRSNDFYSTRKLGAFGSDLSALAHFFEKPWTTPAAGLNEHDKGSVLNWAAFRLRALGRLAEAVGPMKAALEMHIKQENWLESAKDASNLSELLLTLGRVEEAVDYGRQSVKYADRSGDEFLKIAFRTTAADALHQAGEIQNAEALFREAEKMQKENQPEYPYLYSLQGYQFCDLLLSKGEYREVLRRAQQTLKWVEQAGQDILSPSLDRLTLGRAYSAQAGEMRRAGQTEEAEESRSKAGEFFQRAVEGLRQAGQQDYLTHGLLARAGYYRESGQYERAWEDLTEALEIIEAGAMKLFLVDYHIEAARLCAAQNKEEEAAAHRQKAKDLIDETGYQRRDSDLPELS